MAVQTHKLTDYEKLTVVVIRFDGVVLDWYVNFSFMVIQ